MGKLQALSPDDIETGSGKRSIVAISITLVVIILSVYMQAGNHEFLGYDDDLYVTANTHVAHGLTGENIIWAFTSFHAGNWHPVTWLSHMADVRFYGMNPRGHHLTNVAIHTVSSLLLLFFLTRVTGSLWKSSFVAFLFALHPLHVESVAWLAERKDVLSAFFWFLTLWFYSEYVAKQKPSMYLYALMSFVLGLMAKPMLVTLPIIMLLMDIWPLGRYGKAEQGRALRQLSGRLLVLIREKIPFFACSLISGIITIKAQNTAISDLVSVPFPLRIENALIAYVKYIVKTIWPHDLAVLYPLPSTFPLWQVIGSLFVLLLLSAAAIRVGRRHPYVAVGWFWFLVTLLPVVGLLQVGCQSMADRYSYIPIVGLFIMAGWGGPDLTRGLRHRQVILSFLACAVITASAVLTWTQLGYWRDNFSLYRHTLQVTENNSVIHNNLGAAYLLKGELDDAFREFQEAVLIAPNYADAHNNLGNVLARKGDLDTAMHEFREALRTKPNHGNAHFNLGIAFAMKGDLEKAIREYREALRINPNHAEAHTLMGIALDSKGERNEAIREFREALRINPNDMNAQGNLERDLAGMRNQELVGK